MKLAKIHLLDEAKERDLFDEWWCPWYECPSCKEQNCTPQFNYCPICGAKIEWIKGATIET